MLRSRFLWKLWLGYAGLTFLTAVTVGLLAGRQVEIQTVESTDMRLRGEATLLAEVAADHLRSGVPTVVLDRRVVDIGYSLGTRLTVIAPDGTVVADSRRDASSLDDHGDRPEVLAVRRGAAIGTATRWSDTLQQRMRYLAVPMAQGYVARTALPLDVVSTRRREVRDLVAVGAGLVTLAALVVALVLARRVTRPLLSMTAAAEAMAAGDYDERVAVDSQDELGQLAIAFNTMADHLRRSIVSLDADRAKLAAILASMVEGVVAVDREERVVHMNGVAGRHLGVDPAEALGRPIWEVTRVRGVASTLAEAMSSGQRVEREVLRPGLPDRTLELRAAPLHPASSDAGPPSRGGRAESRGAVLVLEDTTRLRRLETVRRDFVGNVSHELKTPLTVIQALVETLLDEPEPEPETRRRFLDKIHLQAQRMAALVNDLLSLSRLESGSATLEAEAVDLRDVVAGAIRVLLPAAESRGVEVDRELPGERLEVIGDAEMLQQAVANLLDNAIKYSPPGERVRVIVRQRAERALVEIVDRGPGIAKHHQERIFERFYRADKARSRELGGTGLGLAIVKHTTLAHGGRVEVASQPGAGAVFRIELPLSAAERPRPPATAGGAEAGLAAAKG